MNHAVDMGSCAMIYVPSFIKIGSGTQTLIGVDTQTRGRTDTQTNRQHGDRISKILFF
jgi:hypothetical protein